MVEGMESARPEGKQLKASGWERQSVMYCMRILGSLKEGVESSSNDEVDGCNGSGVKVPFCIIIKIKRCSELASLSCQGSLHGNGTWYLQFAQSSVLLDLPVSLYVF